jgi:hypothetical protein
MKSLRLIVAAVAVIGGASVVAMDSPHDGNFDSSPTDCQTCHKLHAPVGGTFSKFPTNNAGCLTCHDGISRVENNMFKPAWSPAGTQAIPGTGGSHHNWSAAPTGHGATPPSTAQMAAHLTTDGNLQCTTCHDVHGVRDLVNDIPIQDTFAQYSAFSSYPVGVAKEPLGGGAARFKIVNLYNFGFFPIAKTYRLRVTAPGVLRISHDFRSATTPTWSVDIPFTVGDTAADDFWLDDVSVLVRITTAAPSVGDEWEFYVSYPHLRVTNMSDAMCKDCHVDRVMDTTTVQGGNASYQADGTHVFSHPVGEQLLTPILDADGTAQDEANEANPSNKLALDPDTGNVTCTTCHAPHNADSNSLSVDVR